MVKDNNNNIIISIAGSDSIAGAGIQGDIKTALSVGVHCCTVVTAITAQNTNTVSRILNLDFNLIEEQLNIILSDCPNIEYVKIGMIGDSNTADIIYKILMKHNIKAVLDPVIVTSSGDNLIDVDAINSIKFKLMPIAEIVTPNVHEMEYLFGKKISTQEELLDIGKYIRNYYNIKWLLAKGGDLFDPIVEDYLIGDQIYTYKHNRVFTQYGIHGTGCFLSTAIASYLSLTNGNVPLSVDKSINLIYKSIVKSCRYGKGADIINWRI